MADSKKISPIQYAPPDLGGAKERKRISKPWLWLILTFLIVATVFTYTILARTVSVSTNTEDPAIKIQGGIKFRIGDNYLITRGRHQINITKEGYYPLEKELIVTEQKNQTVHYDLVKLPDIYRIDTNPEAGIEILVDDKIVGVTPITGLEITEGTHKLVARNKYFFEHTETLNVSGGGQQKSLAIELQPAWANISVDTTPTGATLSYDGEALGTTPVIARIIEGQRSIKLKLEGYKSAHKQLAVVASEDQDLGNISLVKADGLVNVETAPSGASISVDGEYRGTSPLELTLQPDKSYQIEVYKSGYGKKSQAVQVSSGKEENVLITLSRSLAQLTVNVEPNDATIKINGKTYSNASPITLAAESHNVEVSKAGFKTVEKRITLESGTPQTLRVDLKTNEQASAELAQTAAAGANGSHMIRISGGAITLGAPRRESGRQTNEISKKIVISKPFFISRTEISNEQYRQFIENHNSGRAGSESLNTATQPVVKVSWLDAAAYCNWLSVKEKLTPVYKVTSGGVSSADISANGYRLPTEAEWAYVARIDNNKTYKFPWGDTYPPANETANLADARTASIVAVVLPGYSDSYATTAPVGSFKANAHGIHDLAGNVSEWIHDYYSLAGNPNGETVTDPSGPETGKSHSIRGSSWRHGTIVELRASYRDNGNSGRDDLGFRIARNAP